MIASHVRPIHPVNVRFASRNGVVRLCGEHRAINRLFAVADERMRRLLAGLLAAKIGRGGIQQLACITGLHRNTIAQGQRELRQKRRLAAGRVRCTGGGRKHWKKNARGIDGLAGTFARCHRRRPDHRHEMDSSFSAKICKALRRRGVRLSPTYTRSIVAASGLFAANVSQAKSGHPQSQSRPTIPLPAPAAKLVFGTKLAGN